jgi:hypothetical protein
MTTATCKDVYETATEARDQLKDAFGSRWRRCPECLPSVHPGEATPTATIPVTERPRGRDEIEVRGPAPGLAAVEGWCDAYIAYPPKTDAARALRDELRQRLPRLAASRGDVLHAAYSGPKSENTDVENLLVYNVDDTGRVFRPAAVNGVRFELGASPRPSPSGRHYTAHYAYSFSAADARFASWEVLDSILEFPSVDIGRLRGERKLEAVWWAVRHA